MTMPKSRSLADTLVLTSELASFRTLLEEPLSGQRHRSPHAAMPTYVLSMHTGRTTARTGGRPWSSGHGSGGRQPAPSPTAGVARFVTVQPFCGASYSGQAVKTHAHVQLPAKSWNSRVPELCHSRDDDCSWNCSDSKSCCLLQRADAAAGGEHSPDWRGPARPHACDLRRHWRLRPGALLHANHLKAVHICSAR